MRALVIFAACLVAIGCGGVSPVLLDVTGEIGAADSGADLARLEVSETSVDTITAEDFAGAEFAIELDAGCAAGSGCFLDPCDGPEDCPYGLCIDHMGDTVCTITCIEECPGGFECLQVGTGPDMVFACLSPFTHLCRPCVDGDDCTSVMGVEDVCLILGPEGSFCGSDCQETQDCSPGYACSQATTTDGVTLQQCVPVEGVCACSQKAADVGAVAACYVENEWGKCTGARACGPEGLSACDAPVPAEEVCNGLDDDCDGQTDDVSCDDGDDCTEDSCQPENGCVHEPQSGTSCDDENVCTLADHCQEGLCNGTLINCSDDNLCTSDSCDPTGGCLYSYNEASCDDSDPCTVADACSQGDCTGYAVPCECKQNLDCLALEDGDLCNGVLVCDLTSFPQVCSVAPGSETVCDAPEGTGAECLAAACHPLTAECSLEPANEGLSCDDGDACTVLTSCQEGECTGGIGLNCADDNGCTNDLCDPVNGCEHTANNDPCDDGDYCTLDDLCADSACLGGLPMVCDDQNPCTADVCEPAKGCTQIPAEGPCDDGNACTQGDHCAGGQCVPAETTSCNDGNVCTNDSCDLEAGCVHVANTLPCDDADACTASDHCSEGVCVPGASINCNDANPCTEDLCLAESGCAHAPADGPCEDGSVCTLADHCEKGVCAPGEPAGCDDGNPCTADGCHPVGGCFHEDQPADCDDGNPCTTVDVCDAGKCTGTIPLVCDDGNPCTDDGCDPQVGCTHEANAEPCDDGNACSVEDQCADGSCQLGEALLCDDDNVCTDDGCDPQIGCSYETNHDPCDDGDACSVDDQCAEGLCQAGGLLPCDDEDPCTDDGCDSQIGCAHGFNEAPCDDDDACTTDDQCADGLCQPGAPLPCDDDNPCTDDGCDAQTGCTSETNAADCDDEDACTVQDQCADGLCQPGAPLPCDDDNPCTQNSCLPASGCDYPDEPDGVECGPGHWCIEGGCEISPYGDGVDGPLVVNGAGEVVNSYAYVTAELLPVETSTVPVEDAATFEPGDEILIIQMQQGEGENAGSHESAWVKEVKQGALVLEVGLGKEYTSGKPGVPGAAVSQVIRVPRFESLTVAAGASITAPAWNGKTGGVVAFRVSGTAAVEGSVSVAGKGFRGGPWHNDNTHGAQGESWPGMGALLTAANGAGGGGGHWDVWNGGDTISGSGGGGAYGSAGSMGSACKSAAGGQGGKSAGEPDLVILLPGSGGGAGGDEDRPGPGGPAGGNGGGVVMMYAKTLVISGTVDCRGSAGGSTTEWDSGVAGGGSGGAIHLVSEDVTIAGLVTGIGGQGGSTGNWCGSNHGGDGGDGRIRIDAAALQGTSTPAPYQPE